MKKLPDEIFPDAFKFSNGEYAWPRKTINVALDDIAKSQCAVLGGEAVVLAKDGSVLGLIPHENPVLSPSVWSWETQPQNKNESWNEYCARTAQESLKIIAKMNIEDTCAEEFKDSVAFVLSYVSESD